MDGKRNGNNNLFGAAGEAFGKEETYDRWDTDNTADPVFPGRAETDPEEKLRHLRLLRAEAEYKDHDH